MKICWDNIENLKLTRNERSVDKMKVLEIVEREDGSADVELEMSEEEHKLLIQYAVVNLLKEAIEREEKGLDK